MFTCYFFQFNIVPKQKTELLNLREKIINEYYKINHLKTWIESCEPVLIRGKTFLDKRYKKFFNVFDTDI